MTLRTTTGLAALFLVNAAGLAVAQSDAPPAMMQQQPPAMLDPHPQGAPAAQQSGAAPAGQSGQAIGPPEAKIPGSSAPEGSPSAPPSAASTHNSTMGAASTDVPGPSVVTHILSGADAAKFNAAAAEDDKKPTLAHAFALTDEQKRLITGSLANAQPSPPPDFKPEVAALAPQSVKLVDMPGEVTAKIPYLAPYKVAVVDNQVLLVDPGNSNVVVGIISR